MNDMKSILIITGAGASHDVAEPREISVSSFCTPPLTKDLFRSGEGQKIGVVKEKLQNNPIAAQIGAEWTKEQPLEAYLSEIKNNPQKMVSERYWAIPIYLHELFLSISQQYILSKKIGMPSNYNTLISTVVKTSYNKVVWINLNYDLLADYAIKAAAVTSLSTFDDYMKIETKDKIKIKYTKPHGSVDWYRINKIGTSWDLIQQGAIPDNFESALSEEIYTEHESAHKVHSEFRRERLYPAISAPLGKYNYIYPRHIEAIIPDLQEHIAVLCVGFGALDDDILGLMAKNVNKISKMKIVNKSYADGKVAYTNIKRHYHECRKSIDISEDRVLYGGGFSDFIATGELKKWLSM